MKILFITSGAADYVQDLTYSGLVKRLGKNNVIDFPWNRKFHINYKAYPKNLGYIPGSLISSLLNRRTKAVDAVVVAAAKADAFHSYKMLIDRIPATTPIVFIDGGDQPHLGEGVAFEGEPELYNEVTSIRPFDLIMKREYLLEDDWGENVHPFPIAFNTDRLPELPTEHRYQVSFWAVETDPIRTKALQLLQDHFDCRSNGTVRNQTFKNYPRKGSFYLQELAACKIILNFRGGGWDTLRYWEVPAVGSLLISQKPGIRIPHDFVPNVSAVYVEDDLSDLIDRCNYYLKHENLRKKIATAGRQHLMQYHTDIARADNLLHHLRRLIK
jgi:hypothetical protein